MLPYQQAAVPDPTYLVKVSNLSLLNDILRMIENLQFKIGTEILLEQLSSLEVSLKLQLATELEGCLVALISNP